jgi:hypothetical protein
MHVLVQDPLVFHCGSEPAGRICNNVLHRRTAFTDGVARGGCRGASVYDRLKGTN